MPKGTSKKLAQAIFDDWLAHMSQPTKITLQYGSFDGLPAEAKKAATGSEFGATFGGPNNSEFVVCVSNKTPADKLEQVIVHELVHAWSFSQAGDDLRENLEMVTDALASQMMSNRRKPRSWRK